MNDTARAAVDAFARLPICYSFITAEFASEIAAAFDCAVSAAGFEGIRAAVRFARAFVERYGDIETANRAARLFEMGNYCLFDSATAETAARLFDYSAVMYRAAARAADDSANAIYRNSARAAVFSFNADEYRAAARAAAEYAAAARNPAI